MSKSPKDDQYSEEETKRRAEKALRGAFKTPRQPLSKDVQKAKGEKKGRP